METMNELRWIGPDPSGLIELAGKMDTLVLYAAKYLAEAVVDPDATEWLIESEKRHYLAKCAEAGRINDLYKRCYSYRDGDSGRWAGYLVREGEL